MGVGVEELREECVVTGMGQDGGAFITILAVDSIGKALPLSVLSPVGSGLGEKRSCLDSSGAVVGAEGVDAKMKKMAEIGDVGV